jgi:membrane-associated protein
MLVLLTPVLIALGAVGVLLVIAIVYAESGLLLGFFLPGDSLLFTTGVLVAADKMPVPLALVCVGVSLAAIAGDQTGYLVGRRFGPRVFSRSQSRFLSPRHAEEAQKFFARHGWFAVILARFLPVVRTFTPVVAGVGSMPRGRFTIYNVVGGVAWSLVFLLTGYRFGEVSFVADHVEWIAVAVFVVSLIPATLAYRRGRSVRRRRSGSPAGGPDQPTEQPVAGSA